MKIWSVFSVVIFIHILVIAILLVQPGCQSRPAERPDPGMTAPGSTPAYSEPAQPSQLDPAFNAGVASPAPDRRNLSAPTRPPETQRSQPDTGLLEPVLEPVQDSMTLPAETREYTVSKGDTLSGIARKEGVSLSAILSANGLSKSSTIYVGQKLLIPDTSGQAAETVSSGMEHSGKEVVVARGDTLSSIAARTGASVKALKALNGLTSDTIYVGQRLAVPESASVPVSTLPPPAPAPVRTVQAPAGGTSYTVQPGDTPSGIASRYGISAAQLMAANNISDPRKLMVGATLVIPGSGSAARQGTSASGGSQPVVRSETVTTAAPQQEVIPEPSEEDPISVLEALEDEDLPFAEVEAVEEEPKSGI
jgi:LysM repeat protein